MQGVQQYYVEHFLLTLNSFCYLVEIRDWPETLPRIDRIADLPEWALNSKHAIWLKDEDKPIQERARDGEQIRARMKALLPRR